MTYVRPPISAHKVTYKGRRYWVVEVGDDAGFEGYEKDDADFVVWDGLYGSCLGIIRRTQDSGYVGKIIAHVDCGETDFATLKEAVAGLAKEYDWYISRTS